MTTKTRRFRVRLAGLMNIIFFSLAGIAKVALYHNFKIFWIILEDCFYSLKFLLLRGLSKVYETTTMRCQQLCHVTHGSFITEVGSLGLKITWVG